jgi:hypothetical protein
MKVVKQQTFENIKHDFQITKQNIHKYEKVNDVYLRKDRLSTVLTVDSKGNILHIDGNPLNYKINNNIYE